MAFEPSLTEIRNHLYSAVICDALDNAGYRQQSPSFSWRAFSPPQRLVGRCKTTLWADMFHPDPTPYALELQAVDSLEPDDVLVAAAGGSRRSGIWGELLSTAAKCRGSAGAIIDGCVRDVEPIGKLGFPVFARGISPYDSKDRQRVIDIDVPVQIGGVTISPGDLVFADADGVVFVPQAAEADVLERAWQKVHEENRVRQSIENGMLAGEAFRRYGVL